MPAQDAPARRRGPLPGTPRGQRMSRADREEQLVNIAEQVFAEQGYQVTTVEDVAQRAGITKPVIYDHFGSKEGLLAAVVQRLGESITQVLLEAWDSLPPGADLEQQFRVGVRAFFAFLDERPGPFRVYAQEIVVSTAAHEEIARLRLNQAQLMAERFSTVPVIAAIPPELRIALAELVVGITDQIAVMRMRRPEITVDYAVEIFMSVVWYGFRSSIKQLERSMGTDQG